MNVRLPPGSGRYAGASGMAEISHKRTHRLMTWNARSWRHSRSVVMGIDATAVDKDPTIESDAHAKNALARLPRGKGMTVA